MSGFTGPHGRCWDWSINSPWWPDSCVLSGELVPGRPCAGIQHIRAWLRSWRGWGTSAEAKRSGTRGLFLSSQGSTSPFWLKFSRIYMMWSMLSGHPPCDLGQLLNPSMVTVCLIAHVCFKGGQTQPRSTVWREFILVALVQMEKVRTEQSTRQWAAPEASALFAGGQGHIHMATSSRLDTWQRPWLCWQ